jgi:hypothetical protein
MDVFGCFLGNAIRGFRAKKGVFRKDVFGGTVYRD